MTSFNKAILLGNLTRDPEVRYSTDSGKPYATFSIAVNSRIRQGDGYKDKVDYFDIVVFGKQAENCGRYLAKGDAVLVEGRLNQRRWDDRDTGQKRSKVEIMASSVTFMPKVRRDRGPNQDIPPEVKDTFPGAEQVAEDDIPF